MKPSEETPAAAATAATNGEEEKERRIFSNRQNRHPRRSPPPRLALPRLRSARTGNPRLPRASTEGGRCGKAAKMPRQPEMLQQPKRRGILTMTLSLSKTTLNKVGDAFSVNRLPCPSCRNNRHPRRIRSTSS